MPVTLYVLYRTEKNASAQAQRLGTDVEVIGIFPWRIDAETFKECDLYSYEVKEVNSTMDAFYNVIL